MKSVLFAICLIGTMSLIACSTPHPPPGSNPSAKKRGTDTQQGHRRDKRFL